MRLIMLGRRRAKFVGCLRIIFRSGDTWVRPERRLSAGRKRMISTLVVLAFLSLVSGRTRVAEAAEVTPPGRISGVYLGASELGYLWQQYLGVPKKEIFADPGHARAMLYAISRDAKNIGFNTLILSSFFYPGLTSKENFQNNLPYDRLLGGEGFVELTSKEAVRAGLDLIVALSPERPLFDNNDFPAWVSTCEDTAWARRQVEYYSQLPAVKGVLCAFEAWGALHRKLTPAQLDDVFRSIRTLRSFIESRHLFYLHVPAAGLSALNPRPDFPTDIFSVFTPQLSPMIYYDQNSIGRVFAAHSAAAHTGIELNVWHSELLRSPLNRAQQQEGAPSEDLVRQWQQLQMNAVLRFRPRVVTWEDYGEIAFPAYNARERFYSGRGWAMSINARLSDPRLKLYDPLVSDAATRVIGGFPGPGVTYTVAGRCDAFNPRLGGTSADLPSTAGITYPNPPQAPILTGTAGSISLWVRPARAGNSASPAILATVCRQPGGPGCLALALQQDNRLSLWLADAAGHRTAASADVTSWRSSQGGPVWHQLAATWDGRQGKLDLYIDGRKAAATRSRWTPFGLGDRLVIGNPMPSDNSGATMDFADLRTYATALDARRIQMEYESFLSKGIDAEVRPQCPAAH